MAKHWHSNHSQRYWTALALLEGRKICHMDEINEAKGWRLGAIIHVLRKTYNWPIEVEYVGAENIAHYWLSKYCDKTKLKFPRSCKELAELVKGGKL